MEADRIREYVGNPYYTRGRSYFMERKVLDVSLAGNLIVGKVMGSRFEPYVSKLFFDEDGICDSNCSCPMSQDCKHVAALYLQAMKEFPTIRFDPKTNTLQTKIVRETSKTLKADWANQLEHLLIESVQETGKNCLELAIILVDGYGYGYDRGYGRGKASKVLKIRPKLFNPVTGKSAFSGISWQDASYPSSLNLSKAQESYFQQLYVGLTERYFSSTWLEVPMEKIPEYWRLIQEHQKYGVKLVSDSPKNCFIEISEKSLEAALSIREESGSLVVKAQFLLDSVLIPEEKIVLMGTPPLFAIIRTNEGGTKRSERLVFHSLKITNWQAFQSMREKPVVVPEKEKEKFRKEFLPKLIQKFPLHSDLDKFQLPVLPEPALLVKISRISAEVLEMKTQLFYGDKIMVVGEESFEDEHGNIFGREYHKEREIWRRVEGLLRKLPGWSGSTGRDMTAASCLLKKIDAVHLLDTVVPELKKISEVRLELAEDLPKFVLNEEAPLVEFAVEESERGTDWFDLNITVSIEGEKIDFQSVFAALSAGEDFLFLENGKYFSLNNAALEKLKQLIEEARKIKDSNKKGLSLTRFQASLWSELKKLGVVGKQAEEWEKSMNGLLDFQKIEIAEVSPKLQATLRPYQQEGFSWLKFLHEARLGGVLADDMGLGKTVQTIAFFCALKNGERSEGKSKKPFLVIAPTSVVENWESELQKFAPSLKILVLRKGDRSDHYKQIKKVDVVVVSYGLVHRDLSFLKPVDFETIILDEAQFVKNHQAKIYGDIRQLSSSSKIALTGTPMENNLMELWSIFSIVCPGLFPSPENFQGIYRKPIEKHNDKEALQRLRSRIRPFMLRRKKEVVATELPPKIEQTMLLEMNSQHRHIYDLHLQRERQRVLGMLNEGGLKEHRFEILSALTRMRQMCLHPGLVDAGYSNLPSTKLEALEEQVKTLVSEGHRALVFSQFTGFLAEVRKVFDSAEIDYLYLDGATRNRKELLAKFKGEKSPAVFLISLKAGGFGLNLTEADYCIMLDPWWNPAVESQAIDRTHRIGQKRSVFVYKMIAKDSVEEKVLKLQEKKKQLFRNILEDGDIFASLVTEEDIQRIFE